jgi:hypothetical protein
MGFGGREEGQASHCHSKIGYVEAFLSICPSGTPGLKLEYSVNNPT